MDSGHRYADKVLEEIAKQIAEQIGQVSKAVIEKIKRYLKKHQKEIQKQQQRVNDGEITEKEYEQWAVTTLTMGKEWAKVRNECAEDMSNGIEDALKKVVPLLTIVYVFNRNQSNEQIEWAIKTARKKKIKLPRYRTHKPILPKYPQHRKNTIWHRRKLEVVIRRGMKKGHSIDKIAKSVYEVSDMDIKACYRTARTGVTAAENMARIDSYYDAEEQGIPMMKQWYATKDNRTRKSHRIIDGERIPINEYFSNQLFYPADPDGEPAEVYNCRCTLLGVPDGIDLSDIPTSPAEMGRLEWIATKPVSKPYPLQGKRGKYARWK